MAKPIFVVRPRVSDAGVPDRVRLVRADKRKQVESFLLQDFAITKATPEDAHALGSIEIEDVE
jgi:hypothetical protein